MTERPLASRAGLKLQFALGAFGLNPTGLVCADFGCNAGGFTDCLLRQGATSVIAVDTGYGALDWRLRNDPQVIVQERTNALHATPPDGGVDLVVIDLGWTPQRLAIPAAMKWLRTESGMRERSRIITLVKPHYETSDLDPHAVRRGGLAPEEAHIALARVREQLPKFGVRLVAECESPLVGSKSSKKGGGNHEWLFLLAPETAM